VNAEGDFADSEVRRMEYAGPDEHGGAEFEAVDVLCTHSGLYGFTARVLPDHPDLTTAFWPGLITWATGQGSAARA
jgi:hypothetical protein